MWKGEKTEIFDHFFKKNIYAGMYLKFSTWICSKTNIIYSYLRAESRPQATFMHGLGLFMFLVYIFRHDLNDLHQYSLQLLMRRLRLVSTFSKCHVCPIVRPWMRVHGSACARNHPLDSASSSRAVLFCGLKHTGLLLDVTAQQRSSCRGD
jgi:hypothetical protein